MPDDRPAPIFVADSAGLDFLNSIATPIDTPVEWLTSGEDLLAWLEGAGLMPPAAANHFRETAAAGELDAVAAQARDLREWFRGFVSAHRGRPLTPAALSDLAPLNRLLARDEQFGHVEQSGNRLQLLLQRRWQSPDVVLVALASAMADVVCNEDFTHIKACEGETCTLIFADRTRAHARRWCSMAVCGNRAKQAAHRGRTARDRNRVR